MKANFCFKAGRERCALEEDEHVAAALMAKCVAACTMCSDGRKPHIMRYDTSARFVSAEQEAFLNRGHAALLSAPTCGSG